jgi:hypothetical protein
VLSKAIRFTRYQKRIIAVLIDDVEPYAKGYRFTAFSITYSPKELAAEGVGEFKVLMRALCRADSAIGVFAAH